jgi:uncharacterized protein (TIGR04255 family)
MGLEFAPLPGMGFLSLAKLQSRWSDIYPTLQEMPGVPPSATESAPPQFTFVQGFPAVRVWAEDRTKGLLVQSQSDRLILNWRKAFSDDPEYPGYDALRPKYEFVLNELHGFVRDEGLGSLVPGSAEYTYVNNVELLDGQNIEDVLAVFARPDRELPGTPATTRFQLVRIIEPSDGPDGHPFAAQILVVGEPQLIGERNVLTMNVTSRVLFATGGDPLEAIDAAHALSSHTFANLTTVSKQAEWGTTK